LVSAVTVNGFEGVGPALVCPHRAGDGHVSFDGFHFIPALDAAVRIDHQIAKLAHAHCRRCAEFGGLVISAYPSGRGLDRLSL
jgi:hypothetical protein